MQKVLKLTNKYIILATVLILYSLISNVYAAFFAAGRGVKLIGIIFALILLSLMTIAFLAGWFKMIKSAITEPDRDDPNALIKIFPEGVGEYFLPVLGMGVKIIIIFALIGSAAIFLGHNYIGNPNVSAQGLAAASKDMAGMKEFLLALTPEQMSKLSAWNNLLTVAFMFSYFIVFLFAPTLFFKNKNPFIAYFISLKDLFSKKFFKTLGIFFLILFCNIFLSVLSVIFGANAIAGFIITLASFYVFTASAVGLFQYYYDNFMLSHLGQNIDVKI